MGALNESLFRWRGMIRFCLLFFFSIASKLTALLHRCAWFSRFVLITSHELHTRIELLFLTLQLVQREEAVRGQLRFSHLYTCEMQKCPHWETAEICLIVKFRI